MATTHELSRKNNSFCVVVLYCNEAATLYKVTLLVKITTTQPKKLLYSFFLSSFLLSLFAFFFFLLLLFFLLFSFFSFLFSSFFFSRRPYYTLYFPACRPVFFSFFSHFFIKSVSPLSLFCPDFFSTFSHFKEGFLKGELLQKFPLKPLQNPLVLNISCVSFLP